jgi:hypothetical protein
MRKALVAAVAVSLGTAAFALAPEAEAQMVIKNPNDHPEYRAELEPHGVLSIWRRRYGWYGRGGRTIGTVDAGLGFRASIELADPAFIPKLNNTVAITFGLDLTSCRFCPRDFSIWSPVAMQWNFFLTRKWSVMGELGLLTVTDGFYHDIDIDFYGAVGGRFHFSDDVSLTMRLGWPFISVGVSFFVGS